MSLKFIVNQKRRAYLSCSQCRKNKSKCDELRPACTACLNRSSTCIYTKSKYTKRRHKSTGTALIPESNQLINLSGNHDLVIDYDSSFIHPTQEVSIITSNTETIISPEPVITPLLGLDFDLDFTAISIFSNFESLSYYFHRYNHCDELLLPLAYKYQSVMYTFSAWILSFDNNSKCEQFLNESFRLCDQLEHKIKIQHFSEDDLINLIVCLTCQCLIASNRGDSNLWRKSFEKIYNTLKLIGLENFLLLAKENKFACWVFIWFFYQDIIKLTKASSTKRFGPLFSKSTYKKLLEYTSNKKIEENADRKLAGPIVCCCVDLHIVLGEVNSLYDVFITKMKTVNSQYYTFIQPTIENEKLDKNLKMNFLHSEAYLEYQNIRIEFHKWTQTQTKILETKLLSIEPKLSNISYLTEDEKQLYLQYHKVLKSTISLFMKFKINQFSISSFEIKKLVLDIWTHMNPLINSSLNEFLLFPLLITGACVCEYRDRLSVEDIYRQLNKKIKSQNLNKVWGIIQKFWQINPNGITIEEWQNIINTLDWDICIV